MHFLNSLRYVAFYQIVVEATQNHGSFPYLYVMQHHAVDTYTVFADQNEEILKSIPPPLVALNYYKSGDLYLFDQLQTGWSGQEPRRPSCNNLHEVFTNIRDDEIEHVKTMHALKSGTLELDQGQMKEAHKRIGSMAVRTLESVDFDE